MMNTEQTSQNIFTYKWTLRALHGSRERYKGSHTFLLCYITNQRVNISNGKINNDDGLCNLKYGFSLYVIDAI